MEDLPFMHSVIETILKILGKPRKFPEKSTQGDYVQYNFDKESLRLHKDSCFKKLRSQFGIGEIDLGLIYYYNPSIRGNSKSLVFFSANFEYAIKTIQEYEFITLMRIAEDYALYMKMNPDTLLVRILGCYTINHRKNKTRFIIMKNVFETTNVKDIYDLKGFNLNRNFNQYIKKDRDWTRDKILLEVTNIKKVRDQIKEDVEFLKAHDIMDYSLAVSVNTDNSNKYFEGVHVIDLKVSENIIIPPGKYCMGIIDILTTYSECKKIEDWFNLVCLCTLNKSCKNPKHYSMRFIQNIEKNVLVEKHPK